MIEAAVLAASEILSPPFRAILWKSLALTIALLTALWLLLDRVLLHYVALPYPWLETAFAVLAGVGLMVGLGFLVAPAAALFAGLFLDDIAEVVERTRYPGDPPGGAMPMGLSILTSARFLGLVILVNAAALALVLVVGFGVLIFLVGNAYLLGREYFELAAGRFYDGATVRSLRARNSGEIFVAGLLIALVLAIPIVNLLAPLFATAFMVHIQKRIAARERRPGGMLVVH
jgi:CysZ protein